MQTQRVLFTNFARTCLNFCQLQLQQQQQQQLLQLKTKTLQWQLNNLRAFSTVQLLPCSNRQPQLKQQQEQQKRCLTTKPCILANFINNNSKNNNNTNINTPSQATSAALLLRAYSKFTAAREPPVIGTFPLTEDRAVDLINHLKDSERTAIKIALEKYEATTQKAGFEGKLAATQWRTRFGRLTKVRSLGDVDPTGTFCAFPEDWLKKKAVEKAEEPTKSDLHKIFLVNAMPFVCFGFLDNFTMIIAGDYIEYIFGTFMSISTMAAAGLGNTISDVIGIGSAFYVEKGCLLLGLKPPDLTPIQMEMKSSRKYANLGRLLGITFGCLLGMLPLMFMEKKETDK